MIGLILEKIQDIIILKVLIVSLLGLILFIVHSFTLHNYLRNRSFIVTSMILPAVALVITTVISKNIVLSLGMIGALSIVRFRNPVKIFMIIFIICIDNDWYCWRCKYKIFNRSLSFISLIGLITYYIKNLSKYIFKRLFL